MSLNPIVALGERLERQLAAMDARLNSADSTKAQRITNSVIPFTLPESTQAPVISASASIDTDAKAGIADSVGVGATFRRKGMLSDVPMTVSRTDNGAVYASFTDGAHSYEMAFDASQIDVVTKAPSPSATADSLSFANLADRVKSASALAAATVTPSDTPSKASAALPASTPDVEAARMTTSPAAASSAAIAATTAAVSSSAPAVPSSNPVATASTTVAAAATPATATPTTATDAALPAGAIRLPDGTLQFGYAPTGGVSHAPSVQAPVSAAFGVGATFRRKGVADVPMTVTRVGDGVVTANVNFGDGYGLREMAFVPDQLDLVTSAPG
jgi:hypothetical protein